VLLTDAASPPKRHLGRSDNGRNLISFERAISMLSQYVYASLASARRDTLLADAERARRNKQARLHRSQTVPRTTRRSPLRWLDSWRADRRQPVVQPVAQLVAQPIFGDDGPAAACVVGAPCG
jgi:hypothetical protein